MTILSARQEKNDQASNQADVGVKGLVFKELGDVLAFFEQPSVGASNQVQEIINRTVHDKVVPILGTAMQWVSSRDLLTH